MKKILRFLLQPPITREFTKKLTHNFHTLTPGEMVIYFLFLRWLWSAKRRFFFEGSLGLLGQMLTAERQALYETIFTNRPRQCFEIGTFTGGGSTFFLSKAMADAGTGKLMTMENDSHLYNKAKNYYRDHLPKQNEHIEFIFGDSPEKFEQYLPTDKKVDAVFFDGAEDGTETLQQYEYFKPYLKPGSIIMFHDWNTEKSIAIKPVILSSKDWQLVVELKPPVSVGLAIFKHS